jgi:hypothetical protein
VKRLSETMGGCSRWLQQVDRLLAAAGRWAGLLQDMACGDAAAAAAAVREGGRGAASMEMTAAVAADVCAFEGSLEAEGWR